MFEEFLLPNKPIIQGDVLPSVIRVGAFNHKFARIPVLFPFESINGICYETANDYDEGAIQQMQYIALELMKYVNQDLIKFTFVDIGLSTRYPIIHSMNGKNVTFVTSTSQLHEELASISEYARYVSSQCIGYQYSDIADYNKSTDNKEAYNIIFISCFPRDFTSDDLQNLSMLIREGKKCGIRTVINLSKEHIDNQMHRSTMSLVINDIYNNLMSINCVNDSKAFERLNIPIFNRFANRYGFVCDSYTKGQIEKTLKSLYIEESESNSVNFLTLRIGKSGRDIVDLEMGQKSGVYHGFIAGQSGSGKSNLLNNIITTIATNYSPDEMRLYLLDYKWGVEFQMYKNHPNVELLLLDNTNIQAGIDALKHLRREIIDRSHLFRKLGETVNNIDEYNRHSKEKLPRILMIIDEVQQLFVDFDIRRQVNPLVKEIAKQGRAFGIHMLFSSQSYVDCRIDDDTLSQMPLRIAFTLSNSAECRAILGSDNIAPMKLPPYSAIYNSKNGDKDFNKIVKTDYFDKTKIIDILKNAEKKHKGYKSFDRIILESQSDSTSRKSTEQSPVETKKRSEYSNIDFENEFGF